MRLQQVIATSWTRSAGGRVARVSYLFMGDHGEYYGGDCLYFGLVRPHELATIVFHNVRTPELNKIAMGFLFHRLIILGRGVTELDKQTAVAQTVLAETRSLSCVGLPDMSRPPRGMLPG
jgi:hypothetical protein